MKRTIVAVGAALVAGAVIIAGCGTSNGKSASGIANSKGSAPAANMPTYGGAVAAAPDAADAGGGTAAEAKPVNLTDPRALIRTADLAVRVGRHTNLAAQADRAGQIATDAGGEVFADNRTAGDNPSAALTLKIPPAQLTRVLGQLAVLGSEQSRQLSTRDVTTEVADVNSRVKTAQASIDTLTKLYDRATKVSDVIAIEQQLAQREAELESLQAQQRALTAQTSMATVRLSLTMAPPAKHHDRSFGAGLGSGWRHFTAAGAWLATAIGAAVPFLILVLVLAAALGVVLKRRPRAAARS